MLQAQAAEAGIDYVLGQFAFGDMSLAESQRGQGDAGIARRSSAL
jgi:hypothetical protein